MLTVTDTGIGWTRSRAPRVRAVFTTKDVGAGTGLGLATVYAVVARSHGRIDVASEVGKARRSRSGCRRPARRPASQPDGLREPGTDEPLDTGDELGRRSRVRSCWSR